MIAKKLRAGIFFSLLTGSVFSQDVVIDDVEFIESATTIPTSLKHSERIIGGRNAEEGQFPYQVSLRHRNNHYCGAAIISPTFVVTAAHCISTSSNNKTQIHPISILSIRAGTILKEHGGIIVPIAQVVPHPNYHNFQHIIQNDIALLRLSTPLNFTRLIQAIPLASGNMTSGSEVFVSGWGHLRGRGSTPTNGPSPSRLQYVTLNAITHAECERRIGRVRSSILCLAHPSGRGVCQGDSGGPAAFNNQLVGVTSFVIGGCASQAPDGFSSVYYFAAWIRETLKL